MLARVHRAIGNLLKTVAFGSEFIFDFLHYTIYSSATPFRRSNESLGYRITIEAHSIEKGLSLYNPRLGFGAEKICWLIKAVERYDRGQMIHPVEMAVGAMAAYLDLHERNGHESKVTSSVREFLASDVVVGVSPTGGTRRLENRKGDARLEGPLIKRRHSVRWFDPSSVPSSDLLEIVRLAQRAPSQCNRQSSRAYVFTERKMIGELLDLQGGARGFAETVPALFLVASDTAAWGGAQQRNQVFVDGAIFATSLLLACEQLGLNACPLNLAVRTRTERLIRGLAGVPTNERLIMMVAVGRPRSSVETASASPRKPAKMATNSPNSAPARCGTSSEGTE